MRFIAGQSGTAAPHASGTEDQPLFLSGILAALVMVVFMLVRRRFMTTSTLIEIVADVILQVMPLSLFSLLLDLFEGLAKPLLVLAVIATMLVTGGLIARLHQVPAHRSSAAARWSRAASLTLAVWTPVVGFTLAAMLFVPSLQLANDGFIEMSLILLADVCVYVAALYLGFPFVKLAATVWSTRVDHDGPAPDAGRRHLLGMAGTALLAIGGATYVGRFVQGVRGGVVAGGDEGIPNPITPNADFYLVSKNILDPSISQDDWRLEIAGLVPERINLRYDELLELQRHEQLTTLTCISNQIGGNLISNARWTGVRFSDLLALTGFFPEVVDIALYADDGYTESIALSEALEPTTMLAYLMNGEPLPPDHGFPARLIVPGRYGIKNVKWLTRIEPVAGDFKGFWQQRGWTDEATIATLSRFDVPASRSVFSQEPIAMGGVAFAGDRGIARVEISHDGGATWVEADRLEPVAPLSWTIWRSTWNPPGPGAWTLLVRATDGDGQVQTAERRKPTPDGATGYHSIVIGVM